MLPELRLDGEYGRKTAAAVRRVGYVLGVRDDTLKQGATPAVQRVILDPESRSDAEQDRAEKRIHKFIASNVGVPAPDRSLITQDDAAQLFSALRDALVPVDQPMVLIGQVQRSGGTLLLTLLDGHPELHCHPYQLKWYPKYDWPQLSSENGFDPDAWLEALRPQFLDRQFALGYAKKASHTEPLARLPFTIVPSFMERLFHEVCKERRPRSTREIIACYLTALFNSWIDCQGLRETPKRWVVGFAPRMGHEPGRRGFWESYPDGRLVMLLRDPRGWYASERALSPREPSIDVWMRRWCGNAQEIAAAKREAPDRTLVLTYEALATDPVRVMRAVAEWLGITWDPVLATPTFNRQPTAPNSSHDSRVLGVRPENAERWRDVLDTETIASIEESTMDLHAEVRGLADIGR
jgi:hypothetical protein